MHPANGTAVFLLLFGTKIEVNGVLNALAVKFKPQG